MSSSQPVTQKLRRNVSPSTTKSSGPLRATIPVSLMSQVTIQDVPENQLLSQTVRTKVNQSPVMTTRTSPLQSGRSRQSPWRLRQPSPTLKAETALPSVEAAGSIRRTASLDAIYLKGQWPRGVTDHVPCLFVEKATQTPEDWSDEKWFLYRGLEASPSRDRKQQKQRFVLGHQSLSLPACGQHSSGSVSPNRVAASTNTELPGQKNKETSQAIPMPPVTHNSLRVRNSVEGFSTEIEKLVWRGTSEAGKAMEPTPDGHRAPIADLFTLKHFRSVDTQTPVNAHSTNSSSGTPSPCGSPSVAWTALDHHPSSRPASRLEEIGEYDSLSPEDFQALGTSPRGRFLCREPPDGCERVETLKAMENVAKNGQDYCAPKSQFVLQPSSSSAFCSLNKRGIKASSSSSHLFPPFHASFRDAHDAAAAAAGHQDSRSSSVPPQWPIPDVA